VCPLKGCAAEHIEIGPAAQTLTLHDRFPPPVVYAAVGTAAGRTAQMPVVKMFDKVGVAPILVQQIVNSVIHTNF